MKKILLYGSSMRSSKGMGWIPWKRMIFGVNMCKETQVSKRAHLSILHPMIELFVRLYRIAFLKNSVLGSVKWSDEQTNH